MKEQRKGLSLATLFAKPRPAWQTPALIATIGDSFIEKTGFEGNSCLAWCYTVWSRLDHCLPSLFSQPLPSLFSLTLTHSLSLLLVVMMYLKIYSHADSLSSHSHTFSHLPPCPTWLDISLFHICIVAAVGCVHADGYVVAGD